MNAPISRSAFYRTRSTETIDGPQLRAELIAKGLLRPSDLLHRYRGTLGPPTVLLDDLARRAAGRVVHRGVRHYFNPNESWARYSKDDLIINRLRGYL